MIPRATAFVFISRSSPMVVLDKTTGVQEA
jgi:hypothetical protein